MKGQNNQRQAAAAVDDEATQRLKKRGTIAAQTKTTRKLERAVKRDADEEMASRKKALSRWENEGGTSKRAKKGGKK